MLKQLVNIAPMIQLSLATTTKNINDNNNTEKRVNIIRNVWRCCFLLWIIHLESFCVAIEKNDIINKNSSWKFLDFRAFSLFSHSFSLSTASSFTAHVLHFEWDRNNFKIFSAKYQIQMEHTKIYPAQPTTTKKTYFIPYFLRIDSQAHLSFILFTIS